MPLLLVQNEKHLVLVCGKPSVPVGRGMGLGAGLGLWAEEADTWLVADCWPRLGIDSGCNSSPLGCGMGHTWPGGLVLAAQGSVVLPPSSVCPHESLLLLIPLRA